MSEPSIRKAENELNKQIAEFVNNGKVWEDDLDNYEIITYKKLMLNLTLEYSHCQSYGEKTNMMYARESYSHLEDLVSLLIKRIQNKYL